ncbi:MAG: F0F1 ATP synthase subunit epsilon [Tannerella sp.]|jgi:F-type H+-transporting ATPase subunit epsilon|nr:F0F1 ATP synthase subunit epsilon [Tannerella sp.]
MNSEPLHIRIISPTGILYEGDIHHATFPGKLGNFSVYPMHAPVISALKKGAVICYQTAGHKRSIDIQSGFMELKNNLITVCVEEQV